MKLTILALIAFTLSGCEAMQVNQSHTSEMLKGAMAMCGSSLFDVRSVTKETGSIEESTFELNCGV